MVDGGWHQIFALIFALIFFSGSDDSVYEKDLDSDESSEDMAIKRTKSSQYWKSIEEILRGWVGTMVTTAWAAAERG